MRDSSSTAISTGPLGCPPSECQPQLTTDCYQELVNKLAWVLGSTYRVEYSNRRTRARTLAQRIANSIVKDSGYPWTIAKFPENKP